MLIQSRTISELVVLLNHLPQRRLRLMGVVLVASFLQGFLDIFLVGLMARMVGLLAGVKLQDQIPGIRVFGGSLLDQAGWLIGLLIAAFWFTSIIRFSVSLMQSMLSAEIWNDLVNRVYANLMRQNYAFFTEKRTANLSESFNRVLNRISTAVVSPLINIAGNLLSVVVLLVGVSIILGWKALLIFVLMLMSYLVSSRLITPYLRLGTKQRVRYTRRINMILMESLRSIRDVQLYSADQYFTTRFSHDGVIAKRYDRLTRLLPEVPRYVIEPVAVTVLFAIAIGPSLMAGDMESVRESLPLISVILVTLLRISGPLQTIFRSVNKLRGGLPEIQDALYLLQLKPERLTLQSPGVPSSSGVFPRRSILLDNVGFTYAGRDQPVLQGINLSIPVGSRIALVGRTGSGKTTLALIILGLYTPSSGELCLDGIPITLEEMPAWQANCALVPQDIRLLDTSVRENIAFGQSGDEIDDDEVWNALAAAQFDDVVSQMPYGLYTMIGENGVKLSGGQRQRLSLARAFYRKASLLILDEATSALDNKTEHEVMQALDIIGRRCTTIVIAHRLSTVRKCDQVFEVIDGRIKASGSFEDLVEISDSFREMNQLEST
tara:strand:+ start:142 stop:1959 length:1818 start_codon:yes stop_codon:yes gene_type:complete